MPPLPLQRASGIIINFHQAYQYWRPQLSSCQVDTGLELTLSRSLERRNHGPSGWLSRKWKNKRRKSNKNKNGWNIRKRREARGWRHRGPHRVMPMPGWQRDQRRRVRTRPKTPTALYPPATPLTALPSGSAFVQVGQPVLPPHPVSPGRSAGRGSPGGRLALSARPSPSRARRDILTGW